jgi:hypothetical protein
MLRFKASEAVKHSSRNASSMWLSGIRLLSQFHALLFYPQGLEAVSTLPVAGSVAARRTSGLARVANMGNSSCSRMTLTAREPRDRKPRK